MDSIVDIAWPRRNTKSVWVKFLNVDILFSYSTPIAFRGDLDGQWVVYRDATNYSRTTGRHHRDESTSGYNELESEAFRRALNRSVLQQLAKDHEMIKEIVNARVSRVLERA
jgi:hypothetical protein